MKKIKVYNTVSKKFVEVEVTDEVGTYYNRTGWNIDDNNESFYKHEIQFSALKGLFDNSCENFHEFISKYDLEKEVEKKVLVEHLYNSLEILSDTERELIKMIYFDNKTERECAKFYGISQKNINKKKNRILCKIYNFLEK